MIRKRFYDRLCTVSHTPAFHASHGVAHCAYFVAVMAEGHGLYAVVGGVMVVYSLITVLTSEEHDEHS
jgi:hypothetical protein